MSVWGKSKNRKGKKRKEKKRKKIKEKTRNDQTMYCVVHLNARRETLKLYVMLLGIANLFEERTPILDCVFFIGE